MVSKNSSFKLDGKTRFSIDDNYTWTKGHIDFVDMRSSDAQKAITVTVNLSGSNWQLDTLLSGGSGNLKVVVNDAASGSNRDIGTMALHGLGGSNVELTQTHVDQFDGSEASDVLSVGAGGVDVINLRGGKNSLTLGSGKVQTVQANDQNDTVVTGTGRVGTMELGDGDNSLTIGKGNVGVVNLGIGDDVVTIGDGNVRMINLGDGRNVLKVKGSANIDSILGDTGNDKVITGDGQIGVINLAQGNNTVQTGKGSVSSIVAFLGNQDVTVGSGGVSIIRFADGDQHLVANGHVGMYMAQTGDKNLAFNGDVGMVDLAGGKNVLSFGGVYVDGLAISEGTDRITLHNGCNLNQVVTGSGNDTINALDGKVGTAQLGTGNDALYAGTGAIGAVMFGAGNDTLYINATTSSALDPTFNGGDSKDSTGSEYVDTVSFANFTGGGVTVTLGVSDAQDTGAGSMRLLNFEKVIGTRTADTLAGSSKADWLDGAAGNDSLAGNSGADTFIFSSKYGHDTISDFSIADGDKIDLRNMAGVSDFGDVQALMSGRGDTDITFDGGEVLTIEGVAKGDLTADQFIF
jgi:serralysin